MSLGEGFEVSEPCAILIHSLSASCLWYKMCILNFLLLQLCRQS